MKNLFLKLIITFVVLVTNYTQAQYTEVINSNKPGFSESPYSVGTGIYQFETNFFYKKTSIEPVFSIPESFGADLLFRTSFFLEKLELNAQLTYQQDQITFHNIFTSQYETSGLSKFTIGAKYLLFQPEYTDKTKEVRSWRRRHAFDKKRFIPSIAVYLGVNTDVVNDIYKTENVSPKLGVLLQQNLTNEFNVIYNLYYDKLGTDFTEISYIITATQNLNYNWSGFIEYQGTHLQRKNNLNLGAGFAYLFNRNFQINTSARFIKEGKSQGAYGSLGISYRIDNHSDSFIDFNENGQNIKDTPISRYNKKQNSFFNKILNIFKKKEKKKPVRKRSRKQTTTKEKKGGFGSFGSRTLKEQSEGLVSNYRDLMDAGAVGMCPFYYADGWWKGGEKSIHNKEQPEEWFGFWGYKDVNDQYGSPRPVWFAMRDYMKGLIISPKNKTIHTNTTIPIELYNDKDIKKVVVKNRDEVIYSKNITNVGYFADQLTINPEGIEAMELAFEFYNSKNEVIKNESIVILASKNAIELPTLKIEVTPEKDLNESKNASIKTKIVTNENFKLIGDLIVSYNTHLGWDVGPQESVSINDQMDKKVITSENFFDIPDNCWVVNASAGISVRYGKFTFKIHDQKIIYRGDWAKEISR